MIAVLLAGLLASQTHAAAPAKVTYSQRDLCVMWAAAQCHATSCQENAKDRCAAESRKCSRSSTSQSSNERSMKVAACAKAMLKGKCGAPSPSECADVTAP